MEISTSTQSVAAKTVTHRTHAAAATTTDTGGSVAVDQFQHSTPNDPGLMKPSLRAVRPNPNDDEATSGKPVVGDPQPTPTYKAGALRNPVFKGTEAEYFKEAHNIIESAKPGDIVGIQMYEFQNALTNPDKGATAAPGYADQQALLPGIAEAAARGVKFHLILDASKDEKTGKLNNQPVIDYLKAANDKSGNITVDLYPPSTVNIDHAKEIFHLAKQPDGEFSVERVLAGGSNWGNHTPANDDGGGVYGRDAVGAVDVFYHDQRFSRNDKSNPALPAQDPNAPVHWSVNSPTADGGGSTTIKSDKMQLTAETKEKGGDAYINEFCFNNPDLMKATTDLGSHAHLRLDPSESHVNTGILEAVRDTGGEAEWANTMLNPTVMEGQKNHEKLDVYADAQGQAFAATIGSANDTGNGLETTHHAAGANGVMELKKTNHEIDAVIRLATTGEQTAEGVAYSTVGFLGAALAKTQQDLLHASTHHIPTGLHGPAAGAGTGSAPTF
jgi:hypothetical protein